MDIDGRSLSHNGSTGSDATIRPGMGEMSTMSGLAIGTVTRASGDWDNFGVLEHSDGEEGSDTETVVDATHGFSSLESFAGPRFVSTSRAQTPTGDQHRQRIFRRKSRRDNHETLNHSIKRGEGSAIVTHSSRHNCDSKCKHTRHLFGYFDRHRQLKEKLRRAACIKDKHERSVKLVKLQEELRGIDEANRKQRETDKAENRQARLHPEDLHSATDAWQVWRSRMLAWKDLRTADVREVDTIPFPVMFKAPYSPRLVSYREVARFWARMTPFCPLTPEEFVDVIQCARSTFLPSRFTGHQYVAAFGCEDDADARVIAYAATEVTSFISDMIDKIKDIPTMDHLYRRLIEFCLDE